MDEMLGQRPRKVVRNESDSPGGWQGHPASPAHERDPEAHGPDRGQARDPVGRVRPRILRGEEPGGGRVGERLPRGAAHGDGPGAGGSTRPSSSSFVMGDALTYIDVRETVAFHKEQKALATLALMPVSDTSAGQSGA